MTPWATVRLLKCGGKHGEHDEQGGHDDALLPPGHERAPPRRAASRYVFLTGVVVLLLGAMALVAVKFVRVKMLPFDNKSEFQVVIDMPEGTTLEADRRRRAGDRRRRAARSPRSTNYQIYVGTAGPYNFNGLVRHYFLRRGSNVADIQVNLRREGRSQGAEPRHREARPRRHPRRSRSATARAIKVAEVPPGPPVLADAGRRDLRPGLRAPDRDRRGRSAASSRRRPASSTSTGTSRTTSRSTASSSTRRRPR